jgi:hypothetical protein
MTLPRHPREGDTDLCNGLIRRVCARPASHTRFSARPAVSHTHGEESDEKEDSPPLLHAPKRVHPDGRVVQDSRPVRGTPTRVCVQHVLVLVFFLSIPPPTWVGGGAVTGFSFAVTVPSPSDALSSRRQHISLPKPQVSSCRGTFCRRRAVVCPYTRTVAFFFFADPIPRFFFHKCLLLLPRRRRQPPSGPLI